MRSFAQLPKTQRTTSPHAPGIDRANFVPAGELKSGLRVHAAAQNQPIQRLPEPDARHGSGYSTHNVWGSSVHDFSRIPSFTTAPPLRSHAEADTREQAGSSLLATSMPAPGTIASTGASTGMPGRVPEKMERALGADFSDVRVQTESPRAWQMSAQAFTQGSEIHVAPGYWAPETSKGQALLGHELGHVLQQRAGRVLPTSHLGGTAVNDDPALEREADGLGMRAAHSAGPASLPLVAGHGITAQPNQGTVQRLPRSVDNIHDPLLDQFTKDTGIPHDEATQFRPEYAAWLTIRELARLSVDQMLPALADFETRRELGGLIANSRGILPAHFNLVLTAMRVVHLSRGPGANTQAAMAAIRASGLPADEQLAMAHFVRLPAAHGADQRAGAAALPNADLTRDIGYELDPSSRPAPLPPQPAQAPGAPPRPPQAAPQRIPWDGKDGAAGANDARKAMKAELFTAFDAYLNNTRQRVLATLALPRVPFTAPAAAPGGSTGVIDIANQARAVLEARYAVSMDAAAPTARQAAGRSERKASGGPGVQNLFDAYSEADRTTLTGDADLATGIAWWLFQHDVPGFAGAVGSRKFATQILAAHHYSVQDDPSGDFHSQVAREYAAAKTLTPDNKRQLTDYRMTVSEADPTEGARGFAVQGAFVPGNNPKRAELAQRWQLFGSATHESLHLREHPNFRKARQGRATLQEGFTEMFTIATLNTDVLRRVRAGSAEPIRRAIEGALATPKPDATIVTDRTTPSQYLDDLAQAERIRDGGTPVGGTAHAGIGEAGVRAAFFEGHVEYLGLAPDGSQLTAQPPAGVSPQVRIPTGIAGLDELAWRCGVPRSTIVKDNPGITDALPVAAVLQGCREHWVIAGETRAKIAAQHGVSEADLARANPDIALDPATSAWASLPAGQKVLIPKH